MQEPEIQKDLVLIGGGHAHVTVLKAFAMKPLTGLRITLVCSDVHTPYSGMLPGYVAGHYTYDEAHIDLARLCAFGGHRFVKASVSGLDPNSRQIFFSTDQSGVARPPMHFDVLSINTGSAPDLRSVPGAAQYATPVKPISGFLARWRALEHRTNEPKGKGSKDQKRRILVVGAGAGGVEMCLAIHHRLAKQSDKFEFHLVSRSKEVLPSHPARARLYFKRKLKERRVNLHLGQTVTEVFKDTMKLTDGSSLAYDTLLWVTKAGPADWLDKTGLEQSARGFLAAEETLQACGHANIFVAGDVADVLAHPREKAGVFAVRQGPALAENLRLCLRGSPPKPFRPQAKWLSLISTGDKYALATRGRLSWRGVWLWRWKDKIDQRFMGKFAPSQPMKPKHMLALQLKADDLARKPQNRTNTMRCLGCGAKVGPCLLQDLLAELNKAFPGLMLGVGDDAARVPLPNQTDKKQALWQSLDYLPALCDDPYVFGKIAANHALSDLHAMGMRASSALALVSLPASRPSLTSSDLRNLLWGIAEVLHKEGASLIGGHTITGGLGAGLTVNGFGEGHFSKSNLRIGDQLILTKPLGTGLLMAGYMALKTLGRHWERALETMQVSNRKASEIALKFGAQAATDITGFGLAGHAHEMAAASQASIEIDMARVPVLEGAFDLSALGLESSLFPANSAGVAIESADPRTHGSELIGQINPLAKLAFDPQTGGGLLMAMTADKMQAMLADLHQSGYPFASHIGQVVAPSPLPGVSLITSSQRIEVS